MSVSADNGNFVQEIRETAHTSGIHDESGDEP